MAKTKPTKALDTLFAVIGGVLLLLVGLLLSTFLYTRLFKPPWWIFVLNIAPGPVLIASAFVVRKASRFRFALILLLLGAMVLLTFIVGFECSVRAETDPADYEDVLALHGYPHWPWLEHFPPNIPENATNVGFYWDKGFLQGSMCIQLRLVLPESEIKTLSDKSLKKRAAIPDKLKKDNG